MKPFYQAWPEGTKLNKAGLTDKAPHSCIIKLAAPPADAVSMETTECHDASHESKPQPQASRNHRHDPGGKEVGSMPNRRPANRFHRLGQARSQTGRHPETCADQVARAKALIADPNYPDAKTVRAIARKLADKIQPATDSGSGN